MTRRSSSLSLPLSLAFALTSCDVPPQIAATALLQPMRRPSVSTPPNATPFSVSATSTITLRGWLSRASAPRRGLLLYLHGVGDNKDSGSGLASRYTPRGWDVAAFDARAHGDSGGSFCTYGFHEKHDVARILDALAAAGARADRTVLFGSSMGAAVALQAAPLEPRVRAVVAQSPFAELAGAVRSMTPFFFTRQSVLVAQLVAEDRARFRVADVSPLDSVRALRVPLLLVHGTADAKLPVENSRRLLAAAGCADKSLIELEGGGHDGLLARADAWPPIDEFIDRAAR